MKFFILLLIFSSSVFAKEIFTLRSPESSLDQRTIYDNKLIKLALDRTVKEYGDYHIKYSPKMNYARAISILKNNTKDNLIIKMSYQNDYPKELAPIYFPVDLGIVGKRICFIHKDAKAKVNKEITLEQFKQLRHGQGLGWLDTKVLQHHGFNLNVSASYEALFLQVTHGRIDLFCRGVNELKSELEARREKLPTLTYDENILLIYDLPRFFYTNTQNKKTIERLHKGLALIYESGELQKMWRDLYSENVAFAKLEGRKILRISNPYLKNLTYDYRKYNYKIKKAHRSEPHIK